VVEKCLEDRPEEQAGGSIYIYLLDAVRDADLVSLIITGCFV
jgi:hypothetical protein